MSRARSRGRSRTSDRWGDGTSCSLMAPVGSALGSSRTSARGSRSSIRADRRPSTHPMRRPTSSSRTGRRSAAAPPDQIAQARRLLRPGGRLLVIHDYGRDDVAALRGDLPEYGLWSRRDGPFLGGGFKVRVVHTAGGRSRRWTSARDFLANAFGDAGRDLGRRMTRPRLSYNVAVYHRTFGEAPA